MDNNSIMWQEEYEELKRRYEKLEEDYESARNEIKRLHGVIRVINEETEDR